MDTDDVMLVTCVDDVVESRDLTAAMMAVMKTTTYIRWEDRDRDAEMAFWGRLRQGLHELVLNEQAV